MTLACFACIESADCYEELHRSAVSKTTFTHVTIVVTSEISRLSFHKIDRRTFTNTG